MKRSRSLLLLALCALTVLAGCGTPLDQAEDAYSVEESAARKSYIIVGTAFAKGEAPEATTRSAPGRREKVARHMAEVSRTAFLLAKLAKEVTK